MTYIVYAIPAFLVLMAVELLVGLARSRNTYRVNDAVTSLGTGVLMISSSVLTTALRIGIYTAVWSSVGLFELSVDSPGVWIGALIGYDFCYYWYHRLSHERNLLWAAHVVHHQSEDYNLSTALRQTGTGFLLGWLFYLPLAIVGVPPLVYAVVGGINLLYQFWPHTQQIGRLGWIDRVFVTASNHRVHHAINDAYIDRNYGGILILWDRLFGTYAEERDDTPVVFGIRKPLKSWNPLWANVATYWQLGKDAWRTRHWRDKLRIWLARTGWRPDDVAALDPLPRIDPERPQRYDTPIGPVLAGYVCAQFGLLIAASTAYLAGAASWSEPARWSGLVAIMAGLFGLSRLLERRPRASAVEAGRVIVTAVALAAGAWPVGGSDPVFWAGAWTLFSLAALLACGRESPVSREPGQSPAA